MVYKKADLVTRLLAALIDGLIGWAVIFIPVIGGIIGTLYMLLKDGIVYQFTKKDEWKNRSIGKKVMNLAVAKLDSEGHVDLAISAKRNIPLTIGSFIAIIPLIGWILGSIVGFILALIELFFIISDDDGRRLGDRWANTQVYETKEVETTQEEETEEKEEI